MHRNPTPSEMSFCPSFVAALSPSHSLFHSSNRPSHQGWDHRCVAQMGSIRMGRQKTPFHDFDSCHSDERGSRLRIPLPKSLPRSICRNNDWGARVIRAAITDSWRSRVQGEKESRSCMQMPESKCIDQRTILIKAALVDLVVQGRHSVKHDTCADTFIQTNLRIKTYAPTLFKCDWINVPHRKEFGKLFATRELASRMYIANRGHNKLTQLNKGDNGQIIRGANYISALCSKGNGNSNVYLFLLPHFQ